MDEREVKMKWAEGVEAVTTPEEPDAAVEDEPGAATGLALEPGEEPVHDGATGMEEPAQGGTVVGGEEPTAGADELTQCDDVGTEKPTTVGCDAGTGKPARVGSAAGSDKPSDDADAGETETKEAVIEGGGSEAEWKRRAEGYAMRAVFSEARAAAAAMGVPENRLDHVARLSDLSGIDPEDGKAQGRIEEAVRAVLREHPELRGGVGTGQATVPRKARRDAFERGFLGE